MMMWKQIYYWDNRDDDVNDNELCRFPLSACLSLCLVNNTLLADTDDDLGDGLDDGEDGGDNQEYGINMENGDGTNYSDVGGDKLLSVIHVIHVATSKEQHKVIAASQRDFVWKLFLFFLQSYILLGFCGEQADDVYDGDEDDDECECCVQVKSQGQCLKAFLQTLQP